MGIISLRKIIIVTIFLISTFFCTAVCVSAQTKQTDAATLEENPSEPEYLEGKIIDIIEDKEVEFQGEKQPYQKLKILVTKGSLKGKEIEVENGGVALANVIVYSKNDKVIVSYQKGVDGEDLFFVTDYVRRGGLLVLFIFFAVISVFIGSWKGILSLIGMIISFGVLFIFILPQIQNGSDPVTVAIIGSLFIIPATFYLSHGFDRKTTVAIMGTTIALIFTGILSHLFVNSTHLSGASSEEALFLQSLSSTAYNLKGLFLAGIIIGALGVLDDITVSQAAIVYQLRDANKNFSFADLYKRSMHVGKDHIASMINTLVLVYTGASLPLLLLFLNNPRPFSQLINFEVIANEIVRTLVGSIGLIIAVPITTLLACYFVLKRPSN